MLDIMTISPGLAHNAFNAQPPSPTHSDDFGPNSKHFDVKKYKAAASTILKSGRTSELRKYNRAQPAGRLPVEILQRIFVEAARYAGLSDNISSTPWPWIYVSHVCFLWRHAALIYPHLWANIDFSASRWTVLTLSRARTLPLSVRTTVFTGNQQAIRRTLQHAPVIYEVRLRSSVYDIGPLFPVLSAQPNPHLRSLVVEVVPPNVGDENAVHNHHRDVRYSRRPTMYNGEPLHMLESIELHWCPMYLLSPQFVGLTNLSLHNIPLSERPMRRDFLGLLSCFTLLRKLTLHHAFPRQLGPLNASAGKRVEFNQMEHLSLVGNFADVVCMLESFILPAGCRLQAQVESLGDNLKLANMPLMMARIGCTLGAHFHRTKVDAPLDTLIVTSRPQTAPIPPTHHLTSRHGLSLLAFSGVVAEPDEPLLDFTLTPISNYTLPTEEEELILINCLTHIWQELPLTRIQSLTVQGLSFVTSKVWATMLPRVKALKVLDIAGIPSPESSRSVRASMAIKVPSGGMAPNGLIWALLLNAREHSHLEHDDLRSLFLPKLEDVYLHSVDLWAGGWMARIPTSPVAHLYNKVTVAGPVSVNSYDNLDDSRFIEVLSAYFADRARCGSEMVVRSLCISRCQNISKTTMEEIKGGYGVSYLSCDSKGVFSTRKVRGGMLDEEEERRKLCDRVWGSDATYWGFMGDMSLLQQHNNAHKEHVDSGPGSGEGLKHFHRLKTLMELD